MNPAPRIIVKNTFPVGTYYVAFLSWDRKTDDPVVDGWLGWDEVSKQFIWESHPHRDPLPPGVDLAGPFVRGEMSCVDTSTGEQVNPATDPIKFLEYLHVNYNGSRFRIKPMRRKAPPKPPVT